MILTFSDAVPFLYAENYNEQIVLNRNYTMSKVAFLTKKSISKLEEKWVIKYADSRFELIKKEKIIILPTGLSDEELCYALRVLIDGISLMKGKLPLHGAAVSNDSNQFLIFAASCGGKSHFSNYICGVDSGFRIIGDDHLILSKYALIGNQRRRIRNPHTETSSYGINSGCGKVNQLIGLCLKKECNNNLSIVSELGFFSALKSTDTLKYLTTPPVFRGHKYDLAVTLGFDVESEYARIIADMKPLFSMVLSAEGSFVYFEEVIAKLLNYTTQGGRW